MSASQAHKEEPHDHGSRDYPAEKTDDVLAALMDAGFPAVTKMDVYGRGKQRGMKIGEVTYDELPKEMIFTVVKESDKEYVVKIIIQAAQQYGVLPASTGTSCVLFLPQHLSRTAPLRGCMSASLLRIFRFGGAILA